MSNHLINQKSPYLLQHAENPVDWYPWCEEAFDKAKREDKPIFVSIGYSTCHWCHVMAHEAFEDDEVADILNKSFISIKVDREERPDIDAVYMSVCQAMTGSGGWPLSIFMTPDQIPFYAATYLPKRSAYGMMGFCELLERITTLWQNNRDELVRAGNEIARFIRRDEDKKQKVQLDRQLLSGAVDSLYHLFDPNFGGFGSAPKFPTPHNLSFLMKYSALANDNGSMYLAETTLKAMANGGIFDHIGGGFSRYSTDAKWLVPHFEKMLYDNALLIPAYLTAYRHTGDSFYKNVVIKTAYYLLRELRCGNGGFFCGQDADSDGVEGKYYLLTPQEVISVLGEEDGSKFCDSFDISDKGNFEGKSIPNRIGKNSRADIPESSFEKLRSYRYNRARLHRDEKILTAWNSLTITALAEAGFVLNKSEYLDAAKKAQQLIEDKLTDSDGRLYLRLCDGQAAVPGQLSDYAFYSLALISLYRCTLDVKYLAKAIYTAELMLSLFADSENGGFFLYANDAEQLITRPKETYDGAIPSGNSAAAKVLVELFALTGGEHFHKERDRQLSFLAGHIKDYPAGHCLALDALCSVLFPSAELVCASADAVPDELTEFLRGNINPNLTVLFKNSQNAAELAAAAPYTQSYPIPESGARYYLCKGQSCTAALESISEVVAIM